MAKSTISKERKFLHDLATPLSVSILLAKRIQGELAGKSPASTKEKQIERCAKLLNALHDIENLHADFKKVCAASEE